MERTSVYIYIFIYFFFSVATRRRSLGDVPVTPKKTVEGVPFEIVLCLPAYRSVHKHSTNSAQQTPMAQRGTNEKRTINDIISTKR